MNPLLQAMQTGGTTTPKATTSPTVSYGGGGGSSWGSTPTKVLGAGLGSLMNTGVKGATTTTPTRDATYSTGYGSGSGGSGSGLDPATQARLAAAYGKQKANLFGTAREAAQAGGNRLQGSILDLIDSLRVGQSAVDNQGINSELAKMQGQAGVQGMVGQGIRSGATLLGSKNAGDSSAAGAIADAYGEIGNQEMRGIGNQYEMQQRDVGLAQQDLDRQRQAGMRGIESSKSDIINNIVLDARGKLAALDADMAAADLPERIAIEQEKNKIKQQVTGELQRYDKLLKERVGMINPMDIEARRGKAAQLQTAGYDLGENAFNFSTEAPAQLQGTGPFASQLPIFTNRFNDED